MTTAIVCDALARIANYSGGTQYSTIHGMRGIAKDALAALAATPSENESCPTTARTVGIPCASAVVTTAQEAVRSAFITGISGESFEVSLKYRTLADMQSAHSALVAFAALDATPGEGVALQNLRRIYQQWSNEEAEQNDVLLAVHELLVSLPAAPLSGSVVK